MADCKSSETKLTRSEAVEVITIACTSRARASVVIDELAAAGVVFAPEPVAEPSDPENYVVKSGERLYVHDPVNRFGWVDDYGNGCYWVNIKQPELFRKVDTPEPTPTDTREEVSEAIARLLEQFGENVDGDPIKPDIAAWVAREYGRGVPRRAAPEPAPAEDERVREGAER